ncbi:MAG: hypothetical protein QXP39_01420 [Candidatus Aenigmatarchaeota archaeon]
MFVGKCPVCGTSGKIWKKKPEVFICPNCDAIFSNFNIILNPCKKELDYCF